MSRSRSEHLPVFTGPFAGIRNVWQSVRYHEASRQWLAILFIVLVSTLGSPQMQIYLIGGALALTGALIRLWASGCIIKNRQLSTHGPYALVRHPLYTGNICLLAGFSLASGLWWSGPLALVILLTFYPATIRFEDKMLRKKFGDSWDTWAATTPAVLPNFNNKTTTNDKTSSWEWILSLRENGEPMIVLFVCYWLVHLQLFAG
ncbi:MAG: isoprenylcysteine carboxylmethyltransferase family protein [Pseudomonadales bacterium]